MKKSVFIFSLLWSCLIMSDELKSSFPKLWEISKETIEKNIVTLDSGAYLRAGQTHFGSLWTRDFCYAAPGLLAIERYDVVKNHLTKLIKARREDGLVPRVLDSSGSKWRVVKSLYKLGKTKKLKDPLKAEYKGEHGTIAMDSNILVLKAAIQYVNKTGDWSWWQSLESDFIALLDFYKSNIKDGLIVQEKYGDWQDSVKRKGKVFLTNFHYWSVLEHLKTNPNFKITFEYADSFKNLLHESFFDSKTGLYKSHIELDVISIDGNLFALENPYFWKNTKDRQKLYENLKRHKLWSREIPGFASFPDYPASWSSVTVKATGIKHYHDQIFWSWLMGFSARVSSLMNDKSEAKRIFKKIEEIAIRDGFIGEVYNPKAKKKLKLLKTRAYHSEIPFSWGAGFILDALNF